MNTLRVFLPLIAASFLMLSCGGENPQQNRINILGAGATFPAPLVTTFADEYRDLTNRRVTVNYQSIGSGGGIRQFMEQTVMFGMSEAFLSEDVMSNIESSTGGRAFNIPITLADVVPTYNLPSVEEKLIFNGQVLADIFLGNITRWDDPAIVELNPDADLPDRSITVIHRSDGSGTTNVWTSYLTRVSDEWREQVGFATSVNWPVGIGGNGNEGVAGAVQNTPGSLGYNSLTYAILNNMSYASVINSSGNVIEPSYEATTAAADIDLPDDTRILFTNTPAENGYPIAGFAWMLVYENLDKNNAIETRNEAEELIRFLVWCITDGQDLSEPLGFARIPDAALEKNIQMIRQVKWNGENLGEEILQEEELI
ncbi:MAG: phosphate ABC transporter substrate-binding protein PstS [Chitinophagales bacterium]